MEDDIIKLNIQETDNGQDLNQIEDEDSIDREVRVKARIDGDSMNNDSDELDDNDSENGQLSKTQQIDSELDASGMLNKNRKSKSQRRSRKNKHPDTLN